MNQHDFQLAARHFRAGKISLNQFTEQVFRNGLPQKANAVSEKPCHLTIDLDRQSRCGFPEVIYGPGKSSQEIRAAAESLISAHQNVLVTRLDREIAQELTRVFDDGIANAVAKTFRVSRFATRERHHKIAICAAGTADKPVTEEAVETLTWMGFSPAVYSDVGVAGPHRLVEHLDRLKECSVIIVVAGAEGALPSVVAGYVDCPVIGVPTSVGYGTNLEGMVPLLSMINSCTPNVAVVNIDAGFKGAYLAGLIASRMDAAKTNPVEVQPVH